MLIGVLALQGDFSAHQRAVEAIGHQTRQIRNVEDLNGLEGLILPGGESSVMVKLLKERRLWQPIHDLVQTGIPVLTTCAGTILAAQQVNNPQQESLGWLPISVSRNAYGDQRHSFEAGATFENQRLKLIFIRAPKIDSLNSPQVKALISINDEPVMVQYKNVTAATFHPELTNAAVIYKSIF